MDLNGRECASECTSGYVSPSGKKCVSTCPEHSRAEENKCVCQSDTPYVKLDGTCVATCGHQIGHVEGMRCLGTGESCGDGCECESESGYKNEGGKCVCNHTEGYADIGFRCWKCAEGEYYDPEKKRCVELCLDGEEVLPYDSSSGVRVCTKQCQGQNCWCPEGMRLQNSYCVCENGKQRSGSKCVCPEGSLIAEDGCKTVA